MTMKRLCTLLAVLLALPAVARADDGPKAHPVSSGSSGAAAQPSSGESAQISSGGRVGVDSGLLALDVFLNLVQFGFEVAALHEVQLATAPPAPLDDSFGRHLAGGEGEGELSRRYVSTERRGQSRQGLLLSFGVGGGSMYVSSFGRTGAFDLDFRLGYGFSDRFQLFGDVSFDTASYGDGSELSSYTLSLRGQTVLIGDRQGNGLNLNAGLGLGGLTRTLAGYDTGASSPTGLAVVGGLSYDARVGRNFALSPELYATWHAIPNGPGRANDIATTLGLRLNFLWYLN